MSTILFCAHDPGGANALVPVVRELQARGHILRGVLRGPAINIFAEAKLSYQEVYDWQKEKPDLYIASTSVGLSLDKEILLSLQGKIPSVYVLDFWNEYWQRFSGIEKDFAYLPTRICVPDEVAQKEAMDEGVPAEKIVITGNPYFETFVHLEDAHEDLHSVLFISQPISEHTKNGILPYGFDEFEALEGVIRALPEKLTLSIRLHPKEGPEKYKKYITERVQLSQEAALKEALSKAGLIVGMFSPVLIEAAAGGKKVISYEPHLVGNDPLPTNRMGATLRAGDEAALSDLFTAYTEQRLPTPDVDLANLWPKGAAKRIADVAESLTEANM